MQSHGKEAEEVAPVSTEVLGDLLPSEVLANARPILEYGIASA